MKVNNDRTKNLGREILCHIILSRLSWLAQVVILLRLEDFSLDIVVKPDYAHRHRCHPP